MLKPAYYFRNQLNEAYKHIVYDPKYQFLINADVWDFEIKTDATNEYRIQMVSVAGDGQVIGYFSAETDRKMNMITGLEVINFGNPGFTFSKDFRHFINDLLYVKKFRKVKFEAIAGSIGEKIYDKHLKDFNGRVVGILKQETRLEDGKYYDVKIYELFPKIGK